jgi:hypothetical protein
MGADGEIHATGTTITSEVYRKILKKNLHRAIQNIRCGMLISGVVFLHDNAHLHTSTAAHTQVLLKHFNRGGDFTTLLITALISLQMATTYLPP